MTFFLHGRDVPGTADGFTMNQTAPSQQILVVNVAHSPQWLGDPAVLGTFIAGATFRLVPPCTFSISRPKTVTLASTDLSGADAQKLSHATQDLIVCFGQPTVSLAIPVTTPATFTVLASPLTTVST